MDTIKHSFSKVKKDINDLKERILRLEKTEAEPLTLWFSGLPCSGKTTIAKELLRVMKNKGYSAIHLDGDEIRKGLSADLDFSDKGISENLRRVSHVAQLFNEKGDIVIASFVTPKSIHREMIKKNINNLKTVYVRCSLKECEKRDVKGMYKKARRGEIKNFIGVSSPFEPPKQSDIVIDTEKQGISESVRKILDLLNL
jgi:adenylyl-sulfate kinase